MGEENGSPGGKGCGCGCFSLSTVVTAFLIWLFCCGGGNVLFGHR